MKQLIEDTEKKDFKSKIKFIMNSTEFVSLMPFIDLNNENEINNYLLTKKSSTKKKGYLYSFKSLDEDQIDLSDEIISDESFASILNSEREIYVGNKFYKYTTVGLYFTEEGNEEGLRAYLDSINNNLDTYSKLITYKKGLSQKNKVKNKETSLLIPKEGVVTNLGNGISYYYMPLEPESGGGGGYSGGGTNNSSTESIPILKPHTFSACAYDENNFWQKTFGDRVKCNSYHDDKHRIQTQFWNENYFIYASIGSMAKYQKKRLIGWSESTTAEYVLLGINSLKYTYNHNTPQYNPFNNEHVKIRYKGNTYDIHGNQLNIPFTTKPKDWPLHNPDEALFDIEIIIDDIFGKKIGKTYSLENGQANKIINDILKSAANSLPSFFKTDLNNNKVAVKLVRFSTNKTEICIANWVGKDKTREEYKFDFNFLVTFNSDNGDNWFKHFTEQIKGGKKYDVLELDMYGAAKRNNVWRGRRILTKD